MQNHKASKAAIEDIIRAGGIKLGSMYSGTDIYKYAWQVLASMQDSFKAMSANRIVRVALSSGHICPCPGMLISVTPLLSP